MRIFMVCLPIFTINTFDPDKEIQHKRNYIIGIGNTVSNIVGKKQQSTLKRLTFWRSYSSIQWREEPNNKKELQDSSAIPGCVIN